MKITSRRQLGKLVGLGVVAGGALGAAFIPLAGAPAAQAEPFLPGIAAGAHDAPATSPDEMTFPASATANADTPDPTTWSPTYNLDDAQLLFNQNSSAPPGWELPASFTSSTGTTLTGTDYITKTAGGYNDEFLSIVKAPIGFRGALFDQDQLFPGVTNLFYQPNVSDVDNFVDEFKTPLGTFNVSRFASPFTPVQYESDPTVTASDALAAAASHDDALDLGLPRGVSAADGTWTSGFGTPAMTQVGGAGPIVWQIPETTFTFTPTGGGSATTLTGTDYVTHPDGGSNDEFVTTGGALYDQHEMTSGITNLYYDSDPGSSTATVVDELQGPLGAVTLPIPGLLATAFLAPTDYATKTLTAASPLTDLTNAGLYSALDLELPTSSAASDAADPFDLFGSPPF